MQWGALQGARDPAGAIPWLDLLLDRALSASQALQEI